MGQGCPGGESKGLGESQVGTAQRRTRGEPLMQQRTVGKVRELSEITIKTDTRDILSHATMQAEGLEDSFIVDIDAHIGETQF